MFHNQAKRVIPACVLSLAGYVPKKPIPKKVITPLTDFLRKQTRLPNYLLKSLEENEYYPGMIETNKTGWENQEWFEAWKKTLPMKCLADPFSGTRQRPIMVIQGKDNQTEMTDQNHTHDIESSDVETLIAGTALFSAQINPDEIDLVLSHSVTPDLHAPGNASLIQHKLGLKKAGAYNVNAACASFISMLEMANGLIGANIKKSILVVDSARQSPIVDRTDYYSPYFSDLAAAVVSQAEGNCGFEASYSRSYGDRHAAITIKNRLPTLSLRGKAEHARFFVTWGNSELRKLMAETTVTNMQDAIDEILQRSRCSLEDIDFFIFHQPTHWMIDRWLQSLSIPKEKTYFSFEQYGNGASSTIPINLLEAIEKGRIKANDRVLMCSPGVGEIYAAISLIVSPQLVENCSLFAISDDKDRPYMSAEP